MAYSINKVILVGNVGNDPEIKTFQSGDRVVTFSLATAESWKDKQTGEQKSITEWHRISIFNVGLLGIAEKFIKKGMKIYIEGQIQTKKWKDSSGIDKYSTEIVLKQYRGELIILDKLEQRNVINNEKKSLEANETSVQDFAGKSPELDDDIPF
jgi:single-strand DNA-binding protein